MLDARDKLGNGGKQAAFALIADPALSANNSNNPGHTAGTTFMGQFLACSRVNALGLEGLRHHQRDHQHDRDQLPGVRGRHDRIGGGRPAPA